MSSFDEAIGIEPVDRGEWAATVPEGWDFMGVPNGGLIDAIVLSVMAVAVDRPDPVTSTAHFLRPAVPGPARVEVDVLRAGRTLTTARATLRQGEESVAHVIASLGDFGVRGDEPRLDVALPPMPGPDDCIDSTARTPFPAPAIAHRLGLRLHPDHVGFAVGAPSGVAEMAGWARLEGSSEIPTRLYPLIADAFPPAVFNSGLHLGPLPTVELTVHAHRRPAPGPMAARLRTDHAGTRYVEEDGWLSDSGGRLVAVSRQIAVLPR